MKLALINWATKDKEGVSETVIQVADQTIYVPMPGQAESLNGQRCWWHSNVYFSSLKAGPGPAFAMGIAILTLY